MLHRARKLLILILALLSCLVIFLLPSFAGRYGFTGSVADTNIGFGLVQQVGKLSHPVQEIGAAEKVNNDTHSILSRQDAKNRQGKGYIAAFNIYEQQTMGTGNLIQLQCFASMLNLSVVQPLMNNSRLLVPWNKVEASHMLKMDSMYVMEKWNHHIKVHGYAPLVSYEEFIEHAPRNVILVQMKYPTNAYIKQAKRSKTGFPHPVSETRDYERGCDYLFINKAFAELQAYNFSLVGRVCYNFVTGDLVPLQTYLKDLNGQGRRITILVDKWRGLGTPNRLLIDESICNNSSFHRENIEFSPVLHEDAAAYIKKYITNNATEDYLAVMARFERAGMTQWLNSTDPRLILSYCLEETRKQLERMKESYKLDKIFISMDIGKYGSKTFKMRMYWGLFRRMASFLKDSYKGRMGIRSWERSFEDVAKFKDAGYIASLQLLVVAKAKCVLFVGGGSFQKHALSVFKIHHAHRAMCLEYINNCMAG